MATLALKQIRKSMGMKTDCCYSDLSKKSKGQALIVKKTLRQVRGKRTAQIGHEEHPDHSVQINRLNRVIGQVEGIKRMVQQRRYCPDILLQARAAVFALKSVEMAILDTHLRHCVSEALASRNIRTATSKIEELVKVISRF